MAMLCNRVLGRIEAANNMKLKKDEPARDDEPFKYLVFVVNTIVLAYICVFHYYKI